MVGMVANLDNYDEDELKALEQAIDTRRDELSDDVAPSVKEILHLVHDLILDSERKRICWYGYIRKISVLHFGRWYCGF